MDSSLAKNLKSEAPSLPVAFWEENIAKWDEFGMNQNCARMPNLLDLSYNNLYWQQVDKVYMLKILYFRGKCTFLGGKW